MTSTNNQNGQIVEHIKSTLKRERITANDVTIEITENTAMHNIESGKNTLIELKKLGIHIAIDDFGTGYSSVNMLQNGPFTELKIDRAFISSMRHSNQTWVIVESIIEMATRLNLRIVAEGVEDNATIDSLIRMGCTIAQGYVFAKPMAKSELLTRLNDRHKIHNISLKNDKVSFLRGLFQ